jgi:hypothetical protein
MPEKHTSGAKARMDFIGLMPGINPRPTARLSFSAACEVVPFQSCALRSSWYPTLRKEREGWGTQRSWGWAGFEHDFVALADF